ncbi:hypothetical protein HOY80DRAFT_1000759 [Tuber brumale]|nr:hypothetical protein HOY80DRAFT_1000759 [Tuber brumale]
MKSFTFIFVTSLLYLLIPIIAGPVGNPDNWMEQPSDLTDLSQFPDHLFKVTGRPVPAEVLKAYGLEFTPDNTTGSAIFENNNPKAEWTTKCETTGGSPLSWHLPTPLVMRFPSSYLRVDLTSLFCEDSDGSGHSEDGGEIVCSRERRPGKENGQNGYHPKKGNVDSWAKVFPQVNSLPTRELKSTPHGKFVRGASNVENKSQVKPSSGEKDKEKTYRIQTIGEVYALQKREGKEPPTFRGIKESRSRNSVAKRLTLREINEPLLMATGYASYKSRNSVRGKGRHEGWSSDLLYGHQDPCENEAYAAQFPDNDHDRLTQKEYALMNSPKASARLSAQLNPLDMRDGKSLPVGRGLLHQWNQKTMEHPHIHDSHQGLLESELEVPQAPPGDAATLHSEMYPSLYGGYGFPYEGPFYNPIMAPPLFFYLGAPPPYPIGPQYLNPEAIPWIPGSTPFTSNMPISVIKKARSPDFHLLQGLEYVFLRESEEKKREKPKNEPPKISGTGNASECGEISAAEYAGLLVQNMTEEANPLLTKYLNPGKHRFHQTRRYVSMPDSRDPKRDLFEEIGRRRQSWSHSRCLKTDSLD